MRRREAGESVLARQQRFNRLTRNNRESFESHRLRVTRHILSVSRPGARRLCILGAGNANDLDLELLAHAFQEVHLADLDREALARAASSAPARRANLRLHGGVDLSGIAGALDSSGPARADDARRDRSIRELIRRARETPSPEIGGPFDMVVSTCLLTQLMNAAAGVVGAAHPRLEELLAAIRTAHLCLLAETTAPGGSAILISDVASSDDHPRIATADDDELATLASHLAAQQLYFAGAGFAEMERQLREHPVLSRSVTGVKTLPPWRWRISPRRTFLVLAITFQKR